MIISDINYFVIPSCTATATATVAPTIGLLPEQDHEFYPSQSVLKYTVLSYKKAVLCKQMTSNCINLS